MRDYPLLVLAVSFVLLSLSLWSGATFFKRRAKLEETLRADFGLVLSAILTLLGLIIGFSFSMSISRYDQRKNYEEAEANAIGTEYLRVDLLPAADAARLRTLLENYLDQRILSYETRDKRQLSQIDAQTARLQTDLWSIVRTSGAAQPNPLVALAVAGMNDVLNAQGYTQAAWRNRIPVSAWVLMAAIAVCGNILVGFGARHFGYEAAFLDSAVGPVDFVFLDCRYRQPAWRRDPREPREPHQSRQFAARTNCETLTPCRGRNASDTRCAEAPPRSFKRRRKPACGSRCSRAAGHSAAATERRKRYAPSSVRRHSFPNRTP